MSSGSALCAANSTLCAPFFRTADDAGGAADAGAGAARAKRNSSSSSSSSSPSSSSSVDTLVQPALNLTAFLGEHGCAAAGPDPAGPLAALRYHQSFQCNALFRRLDCSASTAANTNTTAAGNSTAFPRRWRRRECGIYADTLRAVLQADGLCAAPTGEDAEAASRAAAEKRSALVAQVEAACAGLDDAAGNVLGVEDDSTSCGFGRPTDSTPNANNALAITHCRAHKDDECCGKLPFSSVYDRYPDSEPAFPGTSLVIALVLSIAGFVLVVAGLVVGYRFYRRAQRRKWITRLKDIQERERASWVVPGEVELITAAADAGGSSSSDLFYRRDVEPVQDNGDDDELSGSVQTVVEPR